MKAVLTSGAYSNRSIIANAQRCLNLYPEVNPPEGNPPVPVTHYPTAGLRALGSTAAPDMWRGLFGASNGDLYGVCGRTVYYIAPDWSLTALGTIAAGRNPCSMADNGQELVLVDGTTDGYVVDLSSRAMTKITSTDFYGADRVDYLDTYFLFNRPGTRQVYISLSQSTSFDSLDLAAKTGYPDPVATHYVVHREWWIIGEKKTEVFYNAGAQDFTFEKLPGAFVEHGCSAKYSISAHDLNLFWLSRDLQGQCVVVMTNGYEVQRISTHAIEYEIQKYSVIDDAIGFCFQQQGHAFYQITFPSADVTWVYDVQLKQWHQRAWIDSNGAEHRHRANCHAFAYGTHVVGDWSNGKLYALDPQTFTDDGNPIKRLRSWPHLIDGMNRVTYACFLVDMAVGNADGTTDDDPPLISLRWSDTRGASWGNPVTSDIGAGGQYNRSIQFQRLGMARDRVFELSWSVPYETALNGAWITSVKFGS